MRRTLLPHLLSCAVIAISSPALAQQQSGPAGNPATPRASDGSGEIIVTATRRAETLSSVPIAISAVSGATLQNTGASDVRALNQVAPSLLVSGATSEVNFTARIRGIGTVGENAGLESSVGLFIDGVYRSRTGVGLSELGDIERIEVLRGPQGTLFGRNSTAGLINIVTKGPDLNDFSAKGAVSYGNYDYWRVDGALNAPLNDSAGIRVDGVWQKRDGYIKARTAGEPDINDRDRWLVRGQLLLEPSADLKIRLIGDYSKRNEICCGSALLGPTRNLPRQPDGSVAVSPNSLLSLVQAMGANYPAIPVGERFVYEQANSPGLTYISNSEDWGFSGEINYALGATNLTSITAYRDYKNRQGQDSDFNALEILGRENFTRRFRLFTQELRLQGEALDGRLNWLVGGYYANERLDVSDDIRYGNDYERYANCVITAALLPGAVQPGSPFCIDVAAVQARIANPALPPSPTLQAWIANPARPGFGSLAAVLGQPGIAINGTGNDGSAFRQDSSNYAIFTHNTVDLIRDTLMLTLGARYTKERKNLQGVANYTSAICPLIVNSPFQSLAGLPCVTNGTAPSIPAGSTGTRFSDGEWTGTAVLSFKPIDRLMLYASASKGYKAGGFNLDYSALDRPCSTAFDAACAARLALPANSPGNGRPEASDLSFASEKVNAYEIGVKWNGPGVDINLAGFYQEYTNYQLNTYNGVNFEVTNIQSCRDNLQGADGDASPFTGACSPDRLRPGVISKGFEIEAFMRPIRQVTVNMALTYADARYQQNLVGTRGRALSPVLFQLPGNNVSNAPRYVATTGLSWSPPLSDKLSALFYVDARLQSDTNTGSDLDLEKVQDAFVVVNGRIGFYGPDKKWGVEFWAQNLLNQRYFQIGADLPLQGSGTWRAAAAPASTGLSGRANQMYNAYPGEPRMYGVTLRGAF